MDGESINEIVSFLKKEKIPHPFSGLSINGNTVLVQSKPIIPSNKYYIAINDYLLTGGDNMFFFNNERYIFMVFPSLLISLFSASENLLLKLKN